MDVGAAGALNLYTFQVNAKSSGQSAAVLQALTQIYNDGMASTGTDPTSDLLMTANMAPVLGAVQSLASNDPTGAGSISAEALQAYLPYGGVNAKGAATLFSGNASIGGVAEGLRGFDSALAATSLLALSAYQTSLKYPAGASSSAAQTPTAIAGLNLLG